MPCTRLAAGCPIADRPVDAGGQESAPLPRRRRCRRMQRSVSGAERRLAPRLFVHRFWQPVLVRQACDLGAHHSGQLEHRSPVAAGRPADVARRLPAFPRRRRPCWAYGHRPPCHQAAAGRQQPVHRDHHWLHRWWASRQAALLILADLRPCRLPVNCQPVVVAGPPRAVPAAAGQTANPAGPDLPSAPLCHWRPACQTHPPACRAAAGRRPDAAGSRSGRRHSAAHWHPSPPAAQAWNRRHQMIRTWMHLPHPALHGLDPPASAPAIATRGRPGAAPVRR